MTSSQFQTFMQQLDTSLAEIGKEMSRIDIPATSQGCALQAVIRRTRQGFMEIGKQLKVVAQTERSEEEAQSASEATQSVGVIYLPPSSPVDLYYQNQSALAEWNEGEW